MKSSLPRIVRDLGVAAGIILFLYGAWHYGVRGDLAKFERVQRVLDSPSELHLSMLVSYRSGPLVEERYAMDDVDGRSEVAYTLLGRNGVRASVHDILRSVDVPAFFDKAKQDGIKELAAKPFVNGANAAYTIRVASSIGGVSGSHTFAFTSPEFWATKAGHEYHIVLSKDKPVPDILTLKGLSRNDPRYLHLVQAFESFGTPRFLAAKARARADVIGQKSHA
ncbi:MAG TPA: hypothetical protein VNJ51_09325 [Candidatus Dormibacteraeota bacterium]|nr:hypothetical protein [Candidatus Dormibacteraeota bacterium]